jgi:hypothetical protein
VVCGETHGWYGCYGSGSLGPFGNVGALIEGNPSTIGNTVTRALYIVDVGTGSGVNTINLYIYKKVDTITPPNDSVTITLTKTVQLLLSVAPAHHVSWQLIADSFSLELIGVLKPFR